MFQVKIFQDYTSKLLEDKINKFLKENEKTIEVKNIKYQKSYLSSYNALILYCLI